MIVHKLCRPCQAFDFIFVFNCRLKWMGLFEPNPSNLLSSVKCVKLTSNFIYAMEENHLFDILNSKISREVAS